MPPAASRPRRPCPEPPSLRAGMTPHPLRPGPPGERSGRGNPPARGPARPLLSQNSGSVNGVGHLSATGSRGEGRRRDGEARLAPGGCGDPHPGGGLPGARGLRSGVVFGSVLRAWVLRPAGRVERPGRRRDQGGDVACVVGWSAGWFVAPGAWRRLPLVVARCLLRCPPDRRCGRSDGMRWIMDGIGKSALADGMRGAGALAASRRCVSWAARCWVRRLFELSRAVGRAGSSRSSRRVEAQGVIMPGAPRSRSVLAGRGDRGSAP
jgi:hypothetical protein